MTVSGKIPADLLCRVQARCAAEGLPTASAAVRQLLAAWAAGRAFTAPPPGRAAARPLLIELSRIGANMNQIARAMHREVISSGSPDALAVLAGLVSIRERLDVLGRVIDSRLP